MEARAAVHERFERMLMDSKLDHRANEQTPAADDDDLHFLSQQIERVILDMETLRDDFGVLAAVLLQKLRQFERR